LGIGLWIVASGIVITAGLSQATELTVDQILGHYWRTTYDILVRPSGTRSPIEEKYGLVEANFLSGIAGGITIDQYEVIKTIPGVEVAAPIAMIGYIVQFVQTENLGSLSEPGVYALEDTVVVDNGFSVYTTTKTVYFYIGPSGMVSSGHAGGIIINPPFAHLGVKGGVDVSFLMAGIDPVQEALLIGLEQTLKNGAYLKNEPIIHLPGLSFGDKVISSTVEIPALINATPYISITLQSSLSRLVLPSETPNIEAIMKRGGKEYLDTLPREPIKVQKIDSNTLFRALVEELQKGQSAWAPLVEALPAPVIYKEASAPFPYAGLLLEVIRPNSQDVFFGEPTYRECSGPVGVNNAFRIALKGVFGINDLKVEDVNRVPLETYFPPIVTLRYDEDGHPVEPPRTLHPTRSPCGYIQSPPLILTTLEAARALRGDNCISAIRVRVGGIDKLTPAAQRKIEAIASEIHRRTGLDVDIMVGSSPRRILVHVPGIGYVEEQWVQKNVTLSYHRRIQSGHLLLIAALLLTGGLFAADMAWADLLAHQPVLALQKALGWRSSTLMGWVLKRTFLLGVGAGVGGTALAAGALRLAHQPLPSPLWLIGVPFMVTALSLLGSLYPALEAARVPPIPLLQMSGLRHRPVRRLRGRSWGALLFIRYVLLGVARRWSRSLLAGMTAALCAGLLVVLVGVVVDRAGYLSGTLLGEYILVKVEGYHWMLVGVGFGLAAAGMGNALLAGVVERRGEIGVLKALGWRTGEVAKLFLMEGLVLGFVGGLVGVVLGIGAYLVLYQGVRVGLLWAALFGLGVTGIVGLVSAVYPAWVAARVTPAEAMRGE